MCTVTSLFAPLPTCIPRSLPPRPSNLPSVVVEKLVLDPSLAGVPSNFVKRWIALLGPDMLQSALATQVQLPPSASTSLPSQLFCIPPPSGPLPTHSLALSFPSSTPSRLIVPIHGLPWALKCASLASLARTPPSHAGPQDDFAPSPLVLPIIALQLPSRPAFAILHTWIYLSPTASEIVAFLTTFPTHPSSRSSSRLPRGRLPHSARLEKLQLVKELWRTAVALAISEDEAIWEGLAEAWKWLVTGCEEV